MEEKNDFGRRLRLFSIGIAMGSVIVYFTVFKNRSIYKSPSTIITEKLLKYPASVSSSAKKTMDSLQLSNEAIRNIIEQGDIEFGESRVRQKPCPEYYIRNTNEKINVKSIVFQLCDSTSQLIKIN